MKNIVVKLVNKLFKLFWEVKFYFTMPLIYRDKEIKKPIFILGTQGGGLTLISRILRRHPFLISSTGNFKYWAGRDELQNVYPDLYKLGISSKNKIEEDDVFGKERFWTYTTNKLSFEDIESIDLIVGEVARKLGYEKPRR